MRTEEGDFCAGQILGALRRAHSAAERFSVESMLEELLVLVAQIKESPLSTVEGLHAELDLERKLREEAERDAMEHSEKQKRYWATCHHGDDPGLSEAK
jgi:hypothetical protein